ncbi:MAG: catabolite control protein [Bacilli bacterium]|nr:catabolite control protein [Bacilli bacterium]
MPTIRDVAKRANVSTATVSRVLNHHHLVVPDKRDRVLQAIQELGFRPNGLARGLINGRSQTIGVIVPDISSFPFAEAVKGMAEMAHDLGWNLIMCSTNGDLGRISSYLQMFVEKRVDGIICMKSPVLEEHYKLLCQQSIPVVLVASASKYPLVSIRVNREQASFDAVNYLIQKGHRKVGLVSGPIEDTIAAVPKISGYRKALADAGIEYDAELVYCGQNYLFENAKVGAEWLISRSPDLTAIYAASDEMAFGIYAYCFGKGIRIPQDLSVIGYDGLKLARMLTPPLTTVTQPLLQMGETAVSKLVNLINGLPGESVTDMEYQIMERESVLNLVALQ